MYYDRDGKKTDLLFYELGRRGVYSLYACRVLRRERNNNARSIAKMCRERLQVGLNGIKMRLRYGTHAIFLNAYLNASTAAAVCSSDRQDSGLLCVTHGGRL